MQEPEPMVELTGSEFDLDSLEWWSAKSKSPLYSIVKEDDKYWLKSPRFGLGTPPNSLRKIAKELIPIIKGSARVRGANMQPIGIGSEVVDGEQKKPRCGSGVNSLRYDVLEKEWHILLEI